MSRSNVARRVGAVALLWTTFANAQEELPTIHVAAPRPERTVTHVARPSRHVPATPVPPPVVSAPPSRQDDSVIVGKEQLAREAPSLADAAQLLRGAPGVSLYEAGGVSRLPAIHGMADDRLNISVGGVEATSACANHMNPPLSYVGPGNVGKIEVYSGVTPVSKGGDSIGGAIIIEPQSPVFASQAPAGPAAGADWPLHGDGLRFGEKNDVYAAGSISSFYRTNNKGVGVSGTANVATDHFALLYVGSWSRAADYHAGGDGAKVLSSGFISENHAATLAYRNDGQLLSLRAARQLIPYQGFPNQRMDMVKNGSVEVDGRYQGTFDWGLVDARAYWRHVEHKMGFLYDKQPDNMPMATIGDDFGYSIKVDHRIDESHLVRVGSEFHGFRLNDWWEPIPGGGVMTANDYTTLDPFALTPRYIDMTMLMMTPLTNRTINNGRRDRLGHFAEWEAKWSPQWSTLLGVRNDIVFMNVGPAQPYDPRDPAPMPMLAAGKWVLMDMPNPDAPAAALFNARDRARVDVNFDMTAQARYQPDAFSTYEAGYSRKTRSPNLYERYAWAVGSMTTAMVNWFGDANGYTGNLDLKPEVAHTFGLTGSWRAPDGDWEARFAPFFSYVENYIDADRVASFRFTGLALPGPYTFQELQFRNHKAELYGFDLSGRLKLADVPDVGRFTATAMVNYVYGRNLDTGNVQNCGAFAASSRPTPAAVAYDQACYLLAPKRGDGLYNIMPLNARFGIEHKLGGWSSGVELQLVDSKSHVSIQRNELRTPGYALLNLRTSYEWENLRFDLAIENVTDQRHYPPLGGFYITGYKAWTNTGVSPFAIPSPVPGVGRNFIAALTVKL